MRSDSKHATIKEWADDDRPREKLQKHGAAVLSDAELLAILINTGTPRATAVDLAKGLLREFGTLPDLASLNYAELSRVKGIGRVKAIKLMAAFEIARRVESLPHRQKQKITSPDDIAAVYMPLLRDLKKEIFKVVLLDGANQIKSDRTISEGILNASLVHPREVFKYAIDDGAASIILIHNHPSGNCDPSAEDISITRQLKDCGQLMGIPVRDHLIIGRNSFVSLRALGHL
jgi:DNA repair protein RadC